MKFRIFKYFFLVILVFLFGFCAFHYRADLSVAQLKAKYANRDSKFINIDKMEVHYRDEGNDKGGIPLLLLHGTASNLLTWQGWTDILKTEHRVIRLDLPGYGLTGPNPTGDYSISFYVRFLHDFLEKLNIKQVSLAGNSLGGRIAWQYALTYPQEVHKLILVDSAAYPNPRERPLVLRLATIPVLKNFFTSITPRFFIEKSLKEVYADDKKVTESLVEQYHDMACREGNRTAFLARAGMVYGEEYLKINQIQTPTLLLWGKLDEWIPVENAYKFEKDLPKSKLVIFENLGHVPQEESPSETGKEVLMFLR